MAVATDKRAVLDAGVDFQKFLLRRLEQRLALVRTEFTEIDIAVRHQPFVGKVRMRELKEIALIEQAELQRWSRKFRQNARSR